MALSGLKERLQVKFRKAGIFFKDNNKLFFKEYPHSVKIQAFYVGPTNAAHRVYNEHVECRDELKAFCKWFEDYAKKKGVNVKIRFEWRRLSIFCHDPEFVIKQVMRYGTNNTNINVETVSVGIMPENVIALNDQPITDLPKAIHVVCKQLPLERYKYKVFFASSTRLQKIGAHCIEAIIDQINANENSSSFTISKRESLIKMRYHSTNYFYTNDEDLFSIIYLINHEFITRIEKYCLIGEVNEQ